MNISINTDNSISSYFKLVQAERENNNEKTNEKTTLLDMVSLSDEGIRRSKMPPRPEAADFESMSEDEFNELLEQSTNFPMGNFPMGVQMGNIKMSNFQMGNFQINKSQMDNTNASNTQESGGARGQSAEKLSLSQLLEGTDDDGIRSILADLLEKNGSIIGMEDEEITSIDDLTEEQLEKAKTALVSETKAQEEEMLQKHMLYISAVSAYEKNFLSID